jgi:hyaluronoglucosaminidase
MTFQYRGIVEGFFGPPWSIPHRMSMFAFGAARGMNTYLYAPKDDPYHRERWRVPYPPDAWNELCALIDSATSLDISFVYGFHPAKGLHFRSTEPVQVLLEKARRLYDRGVRTFAVLFDDIPSRLEYDDDIRAFGGSLARAEALWLASVLEHQPPHWETDWWFCPSRYTDDPFLSQTFGEFEPEFLDIVAANLPDEVSCFWTGPKVVSTEISFSHVHEVAHRIRHPLLLWDNYPVNDLSMKEEMHIGPLQGRDRRLPEVLSGHLSNPLLQEELSFIPLATCFDYARDPVNYDPEKSWTRVIRERFGSSAVPYWQALRRFCEMDSRGHSSATVPLPNDERMQFGAALRYASRHADQAWATELRPWLRRMERVLG